MFWRGDSSADEGDGETLRSEELELRIPYQCGCKKGYIVLEATSNLKKGETEKIRQ